MMRHPKESLATQATKGPTTQATHEPTRPRTTRRRSRIARPLGLAALLLALGLMAPGTAGAQNPGWPNPSASADLLDPANWPDDPGYGFDTSDPTHATGQWNLWSFTPPGIASNLTAKEAAMGIGIHADAAWQLTAGDPAVTLAILDSGFHWSEQDLVYKWRLNPGELPMPAGATSYDANGDGVFNVRDYTSAGPDQMPTPATITDPRVSDVNGNGILDPEDLIQIFSDGKDDDGNGYVDDICGWDFFHDDNDPYDQAKNGGEGYSHGTGEARDSAAQGNNGIGGIGVCPRCTILPLRASDSFVADVNHFAEAAIYATDNGASVIQEALGALDQNRFMQDAIDYAYDHGVLVVASAADERSYHHNFPGSAERTLEVGAMVYDKKPWTQATTFQNFNNCSNYGPHVVLRTPGEACSSEATGISAGEAGLVYSMAKKVGLSPPLSANEAYQLMTQSADDVDVVGSATDPTKFPSHQGFDRFFGYGRNDARRAVQMIRDDHIPPEALITAPLWFQTVSPTQPLVVKGHAAAARYAGTFDYTVEIAPGVDPKPSDFTQVAKKTGLSGPVDGTLATVDLSQFDAWSGPPTSPAQFQVTVRLRVTATNPSGQPVTGEYRKPFFVHRDDQLFKGFPLYLGSSGESSPRLADLNGDGKDEIVLGLSDGTVHAYEADGSELSGWPVHVETAPGVASHPDAPGFKALGDFHAAMIATVAVGDLDGDGHPEVVASTMGGKIWAFHADGAVVPGFPVGLDPANDQWRGYRPGADSTTANPTEDIHILDHGFLSSPVLADLDGDGRPEIIAAGMDGYLYAFNGDGTPHAGFPVEITQPGGTKVKGTLERMRARLISTPAVGDLKGDGGAEIVLGSDEDYGDGLGDTSRAYAVWGDGNAHAGGPYLPGWPVKLCCYGSILPFIGRGVPASPALVDVDGLPGEEAILHGTASTFGVYGANGTRQFSGKEAPFGANTNSTGSLALMSVNSGALIDLDGDGFPEYVDGALTAAALGGISGGVRHDFDQLVGAWSLDGTGDFLPAWPRVTEDLQLLDNYAGGDVDGDGKAEAIAGSGGYLLHAFPLDGIEPAGWPKHTGGWILATAALGDLDGDGKTDVVVPTRDGWLFAWHTKGSVKDIQWSGFHHDPGATGNWVTPLESRKVPEAPKPGGGGGTPGCGCSASSGSPGAGAFVLGGLLLLLGLRRRRRA